MKQFPSFKRAASAAFLVLFLAAAAMAEPRLKSVDGPMEEGKKMTIKGDGWGVKEPARPVVWADFEKGIQPTAKGERKEWDGIQNMVWAKEGPGGSGVAKAENGSGVWTLRVDKKYWSQDGQRSYIFRRQKMNFIISDQSQNWKTWRMWPESTNYPNIYMAAQNGRVFVENIGQESGFWGRINVPSLDWMNEEIFFEASGMNVKNGTCWFRCNGVDMARGSVMTRSGKAQSLMVRNFVVHGVAANMGKWSPSWLPTNRMWVDEVYVDTTWARVMMSDKPLLKEGRKWQIQIPVKWTSAAIEIEAHPGIFTPGETGYLYVFDSDNRANEVGFPVVIGNNHPSLASAAQN